MDLIGRFGAVAQVPIFRRLSRLLKFSLTRLSTLDTVCRRAIASFRVPWKAEVLYSILLVPILMNFAAAASEQPGESAAITIPALTATGQHIPRSGPGAGGFVPVALSTSKLTATGRLEAPTAARTPAGPFDPVALTLAQLTATGILRSAPPAPRPFTPIVVKIGKLTATGKPAGSGAKQPE